MNIVIKPVKCGDCNILCGESERLLIDCGSDNSGNGLCSSDFAYQAIRKEIHNKEITDIMISHFHKDHFNGVLKIPRSYRFKTAYLPYSIIDGKIIYSEGIGRLLAIASPRSWGFLLSKNILNLFMKLEEISTKICFIKKGDKIPFDGNEIRVLWPEVVTTEFSFGDLPVKISRETTKTDSKYVAFSEQWDSIDSLKNIEEQLTGKFAEIVGSENPELIAAMEKFRERFETYLRYLHGGNYENGNINFLPVSEAYTILNRQREIFRRKQDDGELDVIKDFSRQQYHSLVTSMNAISIVCDCKKRFVFLGDAPVSVIDHINSSFDKQYEFIKIQHHGTDSYFSAKTLIGNYNLISNGGYERRKVSEKFIGRSKVICTNAHNNPQRFCNYYANNGVCAPNCIQVGLNYQISV